MKKKIASLAILIALGSSGLIGCSGMEVGGRLGVYRVDERQESQRTHRQNVPLKCYFLSCASQVQESEEVQGS